MLSFLKYGAVIAAATSLGSAQTFSACNPMKNSSCPADKALCSTFESDFTKGASALTGWTTTAGALTYGSDGAQFTINKRGDAPTIQTDAYLFFGYVEVKMKSAAGKGIISSIVLESDDLDEVDWEFIGGDNGNVQSNYFGKGNTTTYDRMIQYPVTTPQTVSHTYAVNWTQEAMVWLIDGVAVRTLHFADAVDGRNFPQTPMNVRIGIWAGGDPSNSPGTISWAGGETDFTKAPFTMTVQSVKVVNYNPGQEYQYTDQSGSFQSIKTVAGSCGSTTSITGDASGTSSTNPGGFYPVGSNSSSPGQCSAAVVTVYVTEGSQGPPAPSSTLSTVVSLASEIPAYPTTAVPSVPSSLIVDTGSPSMPATALLPTGNATVTATATGTPAPSQFTGAAARMSGPGASGLAMTSLFAALLSIFAL